MSWLRKVLPFLDAPLTPEDERRMEAAERRHVATLRKADRVLDSYRRQDVALRLVRVKR